MNEVVTALRRFILRDAMLVVSGGWVMSAIARVAEVHAPGTVEWWQAVLGVGAAYAIGYAVQDGSSLLQITRTSHLRKARPPLTWTYWLFTHRKWKDVDSAVDLLTLDLEFRSAAEESEHEDYGRILTLKQLGSTLGSGALTSGFILLLGAPRPLMGMERNVTWLGICVGCLLILLGWIKLGQQTEFLLNHPRTKVGHRSSKP